MSIYTRFAIKYKLDSIFLLRSSCWVPFTVLQFLGFILLLLLALLNGLTSSPQFCKLSKRSDQDFNMFDGVHCVTYFHDIGASLCTTFAFATFMMVALWPTFNGDVFSLELCTG